jgi:uncharacterized Zn finger protein
VIEAEVKGTAPRPYALRITLRPRPDGGTDFHGICSCPVGLDCKHVAAALFAAGERARLAGRSDEALSLYLRVAADHPAHPRAAQALLAAVRLRHDHGDLAGARSLAARLEADYRGTPAAAEARRVVDSPRPAAVPSGAR